MMDFSIIIYSKCCCGPHAHACKKFRSFKAQKTTCKSEKHLSKSKRIKPVLFECKTCHKSYQSIRLLNFHRKIHTLEQRGPSSYHNASKNIYQCDTCILEFHTEQEMKSHVLSHSFQCSYCPENFSKAILLGCHMAEHNQDGNVSCPLCQHEFRTLYGNVLQAHINKRHLKKTDNYCEQCGASYFKKSQLLEHVNVIHLKQAPLKCVVCAKEFLMKTSLYKHQVDNHKVLIDGDLPSNYCIVCKRTFLKIASLERHLKEKHYRAKRHKEKKIFVCDVCGEKFGYRQSLVVHQKGHQGIKPYKCSFCLKPFKLNSQRLDHEAVHTKLRPFTCEQCGHTFKLIKSLRVHLKIHQEKKDFICKFCEKGFNRNDHFKIHLKSCKNNPKTIKNEQNID